MNLTSCYFLGIDPFSGKIERIDYTQNEISERLEFAFHDWFLANDHVPVEVLPPIKVEKKKIQNRNPADFNKFIPSIHKRKVRKPPSQGELAKIRKLGQHYLQSGNFDAAMLQFKKICEITIFKEKDWKRLLRLAQEKYQDIVPRICEQIVTYVQEGNVLKEASQVLRQRKMLA